MIGFRVVTTVCALLLAAASVFRSQGWFIHDIYYAQEFLGGDKATHFWAGSVFMLCATAWLFAWRSWARFFVAFVVVFASLVLEEVSQQWTGTRTFSWFDMAATLAGAGLITLVVFALRLMSQSPNNSGYTS